LILFAATDVDFEIIVCRFIQLYPIYVDISNVLQNTLIGLPIFRHRPYFQVR